MLSVMRLAAFAVLVLSFLSSVTDVSVAARIVGRGTPTTNAERLARGLGPARPRRLYSGTRTNAARAVPSGSAGTTLRGVIKFVKSDGSVFGYMGANGYSSGINGADTYSYTIPTPATAVVGFTDVTNTAYRLAAFASSDKHLGPGYGTVVYLESIVSGATPAGSGPVSSEGIGYFGGVGETTIFSVDPNTGKVTIQWVNSDGSVVNPSIYVSGSTIFLTGDLAAVTSNTDSYTLVDMYYDTVTTTVL
ncbi:hypothetical protein L226DRAFT_596755 [Lentinus tigrinus ALCF2SS1-7]|uniref:Uncharacterized protein n=1 Tax=Lentinus tigrinus ALCF2SS1-6 TaxID=1328759 RepID=A0A5C2RT10_9APHY|nr:hypothetical protein L227DRAFT_604035 [Lentinus tigrinus ALCF2SS1-6]RPD69347.1 hypothetical protein L226DRAFT_596755 [Lentinus tigrinus ALCF2SS1-7]